MTRPALLGLGAIWILTGLSIFAQPQTFYDTVPGLALMGAFNAHFIRDVGLAFLASGGVTAWGAARDRGDLAAAGIVWPALHALFHAQIWSHRGFPFDAVFLFDLAAVMAPALLGAACAWLMIRGRSAIRR